MTTETQNQTLRALLDYANSPETLDTEREDCEFCKGKKSHVSNRSKTAFYWTLGLCGLATWLTCLVLTDDHRPSVGSLFVVFIIETAGAVFAWPKVESRARREAHQALERNKRQTVRMALAFQAFVKHMHRQTLGPLGSLNFELPSLIEAFQQKAMAEQYRLRMQGGDRERLMELLSAVAHGREINAEFTAYRDRAERFLDINAQLASLLNLDVQVDPEKEPEAYREFTDQCLELFRTASRWHDALRKAVGQKTADEMQTALGENFDHAGALAVLEKLLKSLPPVPLKD